MPSSEAAHSAEFSCGATGPDGGGLARDREGIADAAVGYTIGIWPAVEANPLAHCYPCRLSLRPCLDLHQPRRRVDASLSGADSSVARGNRSLPRSRPN